MKARTDKGHVTWTRASAFIVMAALTSLAWSFTALAEEIQWRSGSAGIAQVDQASLDTAIAGLAGRENAGHVVVQFNGPVGSAQREQLRQAGVNLLRPLGNGSYFASLSADGVDAPALQALPAITGLEPIDRTWKLDPRILAGEVPDWAVVGQAITGERIVGVYVLFHPDVALFGDATDAVGRHGGQVRDDLEAINGLVVELPESNLQALADEDAVQWIEWPLPRMSVVNNSNQVRVEADVVQAPPYNLDGSGVMVLVYDGGTARSTHVDFQGRLTVHDSSGMHYHSTHVAGTIGGAGVANALYEGMAPGVTMVSYGFEYDGSGIFLYSNPGDIEDDYSEAISTYGAVIANNSIGTNTETNGFDCAIQGNYGVTSELIDTIVRGDGANPLFDEPFRIVWANGNERQGSRCDVEGYGDYYSTAPPAGAKNHIAVGALNSNDDSMTTFSSWGPTDDGRMKPDISAPGCQSNDDGGVTSCTSTSDTAYTTLCGTSMAAPTVCGVSALLLEDFRSQFPSEPDPRNSTLKALLAHEAVDVFNPGPDYKSGYGSVRIAQTIDFMRTENFLEAEVDQGGTYSVLVLVEASDPELKVTLAWDDYPGTPNVDPALVNDLDLRVYDPSSGRHYPWTLDRFNPSVDAVQTQENHLDNLEQVFVSVPAAGVWRIEVYGYDVSQGPQTFSVCASPLMVNCSSTGTIALDAALYGCTATAGIQVIDCDLNTDDFTVETVTVTIESDTEPGGESVLLTETGAATADFRGSIPLDTVNSAGVLQVTDGDTITATYIDADDGQGGINVPVYATAAADCTGPVISNVQVTGIGSQSATVTFDTDESAVGTVRYGLSCGSLTESATESGSGTSHSIELTGLDFATRYYFAVDAVDDQDNSSTDDNGGECYSFSTPNVVYDFPLDTNPGWTTAGDWAFGVPTGGGSYNGDPTSGYTGSNVYGYNLAGDYTNSLPATYLTTTAIDCSGLTDVNLAFRRWLGVESNSNFDEATIEASNNGSSWTVIWRATDLGVDVADTSWQLMEYDISTIADNQATVYVRWGMGPTDTNLTFPGWNIDDIQIIAAGGTLAIAFPDGLPEYLTPGQPTDINVRIIEGDETYVPGSGTLYYRYYGGAFSTAPLVPQSGDLHTATLPPAACDATPEYYFSAEGSESGVVYQPPTAPAATYTAAVGELITILADDFETDQGWTTDTSGGPTSGFWERGTPVNDPSWEYDPASDSDGSGQCYLTQNEIGNTDVDAGHVILISPTIDMSAGEVNIAYDYFLRLTDASTDRMLVRISNDGGVGSWIEIARHDTNGGLSWRSNVIDQDDLDAAGVTLTSTMVLRFDTNDADPQSINESGLDAFVVSSFACEAPGSCTNGILDTGEDRIDCGGPCPPCECTSDGQCDDGTYCDGAEICDAYGYCQEGTPVDCPDDGEFCNGTEFCDENADTCGHTGDPCTPPEVCDEEADMCVLEYTTIDSAASCLDHGVQEYCLDMAMGRSATVEPRLGGVTKLMLQTVDPVEAGSTTADATCVNNVYNGTITVTADGTTTVQVDPDPFPDQDCCTIVFTGGIEDSIDVQLLAGDVDSDVNVSTADGSSITQRLGLALDGSNFWYDVDLDQNITTADGSFVTQRLGNVAPSCP